MCRYNQRMVEGFSQATVFIAILLGLGSPTNATDPSDSNKPVIRLFTFLADGDGAKKGSVLFRTGAAKDMTALVAVKVAEYVRSLGWDLRLEDAARVAVRQDKISGSEHYIELVIPRTLRFRLDLRTVLGGKETCSRRFSMRSYTFCGYTGNCESEFASVVAKRIIEHLGANQCVPLPK